MVSCHVYRSFLGAVPCCAVVSLVSFFSLLSLSCLSFVPCFGGGGGGSDDTPAVFFSCLSLVSFALVLSRFWFGVPLPLPRLLSAVEVWFFCVCRVGLILPYGGGQRTHGFGFMPKDSFLPARSWGTRVSARLSQACMRWFVRNYENECVHFFFGFRVLGEVVRGTPPILSSDSHHLPIGVAWLTKGECGVMGFLPV